MIAAQSALAQRGPNNIQPELIIRALESFHSIAFYRDQVSECDNLNWMIWLHYSSSPGAKPLINDGHWFITRNNHIHSPAIEINYIFTVWGDIIIIIWCLGASARISWVSDVSRTATNCLLSPPFTGLRVLTLFYPWVPIYCQKNFIIFGPFHKKVATVYSESSFKFKFLNHRVL